MSFQTPEFIVFLAATVFIYYFIPRHRARIIFLALANILFYIYAGFQALLIFFGMCVLSYYSGQIISMSKRPKLTLVISIAVLVCNLALFKYFLFYYGYLFQLNPITRDEIYIPLGISFYTFQMISYLVDIYKGKLKACNSIVIFWVYIAFFGHLVAGPIMRGSELIPQIEDEKLIEKRSFETAILLIILGLFKKLVIADSIAIYVNKLVNQAGILLPIQGVKLAWLFGFQIYYDFSAYTDIALGVGLLFGIKLLNNFRGPYLCSDPSDFWKRWHISLTKWVRDYIYFPLGGSRKGRLKTICIIMITWAVMGLWHGATLNFMVWGVYNGMLVVISKNLSRYIDLISKRREKFVAFIKPIISFMWLYMIMLGWILFRVSDFYLAARVFAKSLLINPLNIDLNLIAIITGGIVLHYLEIFVRENSKIKELWYTKIPYIAKGSIYYLLVLIIIYFIKEKPSVFIYFQF